MHIAPELQHELLFLFYLVSGRCWWKPADLTAANSYCCHILHFNGFPTIVL